MKHSCQVILHMWRHFSYMCHHKGHSQQLIFPTFKWKFKTYTSLLI